MPEFADPASGICRGICLVQFGELAHGMLSLGTAGAPGPFPAYGAVRGRKGGQGRQSLILTTILPWALPAAMLASPSVAWSSDKVRATTFR